jgi:hypothetical protein
LLSKVVSAFCVWSAAGSHRRCRLVKEGNEENAKRCPAATHQDFPWSGPGP